MFGGFIYPDGKLFVDYIEDFIEFEKAFLEKFSEMRETNVFTYPVLTYCLVYRDGEFKDEEFARWASKHNMKWADQNFMMTADTTTAASCPLAGDTDIIYWSDRYKSFFVSPIKEVYNRKVSRGQEPTVITLSNGQEIKCRINKFDSPIEYEIELVNGEKIKTTANHLNKVFGKDYVQTKDLTTNDYLPYGRNVYQKYSNMSYEDGYLVGMFLGDGSYSDNNAVTFSLNTDTDQDAIEFLNEYCTKQYNAKIRNYLCRSQISGKKKCENVKVISSYLRGLIEQFVEGDCALNKCLNYSFMTCSKEFRQGIIDGLYKTDGGNNNRIYTSSTNMVKSLKVLFSSLGMVCRINEDNRENRLSENTCYTVRFYSPANRTKMKDIYILEDDYFWMKIKSITRVSGQNSSYCLEVLDENVEPIFTLGNGIITHNCRLRSDFTKLKGVMNSIGGSSLDIGSVTVITLNLAGIALQAIDETKEEGNDAAIGRYYQLLNYYTKLCIEANDVVRHIIERNIEKGILPNYSYGLVKLERQFNTLGSRLNSKRPHTIFPFHQRGFVFIFHAKLTRESKFFNWTISWESSCIDYLRIVE